MKKLLAIMLLGLSISVSADVLDSEKTDYEYEGESCTNSTINDCTMVPYMLQHRSTRIPLIFNMHSNRAYYRLDAGSWYWRHVGIRSFNPGYR